jgi:hypothetical protein
MFQEALVAQSFADAFQALQMQKKRIVVQKIEILISTPDHPSLKAHQVRRNSSKSGQIWECYTDEKMRVLYEIRQKTLVLWRIGGHAIIDRVHLRNFNDATIISSWKSLSADMLSMVQAPPQSKAAELSNHRFLNHNSDSSL